MEAYDAYKIYHALKLHFTSNYDYTKYNGKANVSTDSFLKRNDRPFFGKVARKYKEDTKDFFVSPQATLDSTQRHCTAKTNANTNQETKLISGIPKTRVG